jgi:hypothetical protein
MPTCPTCGLFNPPDALRCDCGYSFVIDPTGMKRCPEGGAIQSEASTLCACGYRFTDHRTTARRCPACGLLNPPDTVVCDCGYRLTSDRLSIQPQTGIPWLYQLCLLCILIWTALCLVGACYGMVNIAQQPTPTDPYARIGHDIGTTLGLGLWAVIWVVPTVGLGVIGLLAKPRQ